MPKLVSSDLKKGSVLQCKKTLVKGMWGDELQASMKPIGVDWYNVLKQKLETPLVVGNKYEVMEDCVKKNGQLILIIKDLSTGEVGYDFWVSFNGCFEMLTPAIKAPIDESKLASENEFKLNENEEFVLVSKKQPDLVYKSTVNNWYTEDKSDVVINGVVFSKRVGQRKKLKNLQTLYGFLHNSTGCLESGYWDGKINDDEQNFNLKMLDNVPEWIVGPKTNYNFDELELRKYNKDTKKITSVAIDFDVDGYSKKYEELFEVSKTCSPAVSAVLDQLIKDGKEEEFPYIFSSKFDWTKFKYRSEVPNDKDIYLDLAIKNSGFKKKEMYWNNSNGFSSIAFKTEEELKAFISVYKKEPLKVIQTYNVKELEKNLNLKVIKDFYRKESLVDVKKMKI